MKVLVSIFRIVVGVVFIYSGFVKANDPLGFSYKLDEYFEVFGTALKSQAFTDFMLPFSLFLAIFMCVLEMILGFALLIGARIKLTLWLLLALVIFFGFLTFYSAYFDVVKTCGCFGDAIKLTPWQSFTKDIVLMALIIVIFIGKSNINPLVGSKFENFLMSVFIFASVAFPIYTWNYLPIIDYRPYAIGKNIPEQTIGKPDVTKFYYKLKDKKTGEEKEFDAFPPDYDKYYDYIDTRTEVITKGIDPPIKDFALTDLEGNDITQTIISNPDNNFLLIAYSLDGSDTDVQGRINDFFELCQKDGKEFICLTASSLEKIASFKKENKAGYDFVSCDGTVLKTMIRSNPGLMLLKNGTVIDIWHYHSFPSYNDVKTKYFGGK